TAALAAAITMVSALVIMRLDEWTKGLTTTSGAHITKVIPHIARGGGYRTFIQIINDSSATVRVGANFYNPSGTVSTVTFKKDDLKGNVSSMSGSIVGESIPAGGILLLDFDNSGDLVTNWGFITSDGPVVIATAFEVRNSAHALISLVGVPASAADMKQFVIPRVRNTTTGLDVGFAVANTGTNEASITVTMRNSKNEMMASRVLTLKSKEQTAIFAYQFFEGVGLTDPQGTSYSFLDFSSSSSQFAAIALAVEGTNLAGFPVEK